MKRTHQRLLILSIVCIVGLGIFFLRDTEYFSPEPEAPFSSLQEEKIASIEITGEGFTESLKRSDGSWVVVEGDTEFPADQGRVNTLIDAFTSVTKDTVASENPDRHESLGIKDKNVTIQAGNDTYMLYIGNTTNISRNFIRVGDEETVYIASGLNQMFTPEDYRDLTIPFVQNETAVTSIEIVDQGVTVTLTKEEDTWTANGETLNDSEMSFYLSELSAVRATSILDEDPVTEQGLFADKTITVQEADTTKTIAFYPKDETTRYAKRQDGETVYEITDSLVDNLMKSPEDLVAEDPEE